MMEARRRLQTPDLIRDGMRRLAELSRETVLFAVRDEDGMTMTYVDKIESRFAVRFTVALGDRRPLWCTASGRALLASEPDEAVQKYLERIKPQRLTAKTETDRRQLLKAIAGAREMGVAQTMDQYSDGVAGSASVVRDAGGHVLGAIMVAAPSARFQDQSADLARLVLDEAKALSRTLGYRG
jgi:DNA-binding IclR family transcriptional regulator